MVLSRARVSMATYLFQVFVSALVVGDWVVSKVAVVELSGGIHESFQRALKLIGSTDDLNKQTKSVVIKVGVFSHKVGNHSSVDVVNEIVNSFDKASHIFLAESDNYKGKALDRLKIWEELFTNRVTPLNLSDEEETRPAFLAGQEMMISNRLFKPNVFVNTHILRTFERGSILKNLFGCIPTPKKSKFHKNEILYPLLTDIYEAIGGIDLAVLDGEYLWQGAGGVRVKTDILLIGRDAVAVETVGATLAGLNPEKMPVIREFVKRGLGEGDLKNIEIVGATWEHLEKKFSSATRKLEETAAKRILGDFDPLKDDVASIVKRSGSSKTRVIRALRHLGYTVGKDGIID